MFQERFFRQVERHLKGQRLPLSVELWNGQKLELSDSPRVTIRVHHPRALSCLARPSLGKFAKAYVEGEIDLEGDSRDILVLGEGLCGPRKKGDASSLGWWRHTRQADRQAISLHYDVSNDFYGLWLDRRRVYSCAYFRHPDDGLDQAQEQKLEHICRKLDLREGERFLDIGCGWGALVVWAAERYGVRATGITLSRNQHDYAQEQIRQHGLEGRCEVRLMDYRDVPESQPFDKIASVGMFEHVGRKNQPLYFGKIQRLLKPGGLVLNHGVTRAGLNLGDASDFIEEYVFPGGELVHVSQVVETLSQQGLECWDVECLRPHYAKTLWHWVERLEAWGDQARSLVGERKLRIWRIYMAGFAHAFERGWLSVYQVLGAKQKDDGAVAYPLTREHVYPG
jgi:cyclopropane-fatty-acyl-phospholipid synthase